MTMGEKIKILRKGMELPISFVAEFTGISEDHLIAVEEGTRGLSSSEITVFANLFGISEKQLKFQPIKFDIVLAEKIGEKGLTISDCQTLFALLNGTEAFPIEVLSRNAKENVAIGFISQDAGARMDWDYTNLIAFIGNLLNGMDDGSENGIHKFGEFDVYLLRK